MDPAVRWLVASCTALQPGFFAVNCLFPTVPPRKGVNKETFVCVCARAVEEGKNNIVEGSPHGSRAPNGRLGRQLKKTNHAVLAVRGSVSDACLGRGRGPCLSRNLW